MLSQIHLIRHGETAWSKSHQFTGSTDIPLTAQGEQSARQLGERLRGATFAQVLTSPRLRARRTCELAALPMPANTGVQIDPRLAEWDYGDYEGKLSADVRVGNPRWNLFRDGCPGGESPAQVSARADSLIAHLRALTGDAAIFTHGHFGRVMAARWIGLPLANAQNFILSTASISILGYEHNKSEEPAIVLWNS
jgi:broad specificity phosphatase PhoE